MAGPVDHDDDEAIVATFLVELLDDRTRGEHKGVDWYQARYPGYEELIEREFDRAIAAAGAAPEQTNTDEALLDRFRVDGEVGRGGMGVVVQAYEQRLERRVAIKRLRDGGRADDYARFLEEAKVTAQLDHPGIVPVYELCTDDDGSPFFTMPLVRGDTLADVIAASAQHEKGWSAAVNVLLRVCETVAFAHSKGVIHRDLKPQNIMVGRFGEVYVMDWGLARAGNATTTPSPEDAAGDSIVTTSRDGSSAQWTMQGTIVGTPAYMAPEQARGEATVDARADVYAIGAMLYHALSGRAPYGGPDSPQSSRAVLDLVVAGPPTPLAQIHPDTPAELIAITERAMARDPDARYRDVQGLRTDLRDFTEGRVVRSFEQGAWVTARKWLRRNPMTAAAGATAMLALIVGLFVSLFYMSQARAMATRANRSFLASLEAVESMLTRVGNESLDGVPQATEVRRDLLADAEKLYVAFMKERPDDADLMRRAASVHYAIAELYWRMGDAEQGTAANDRSRELWRALRQRVGPTEAIAVGLAETHHQRAVHRLDIGDGDRACDDLTIAAATIESWLEHTTSEQTLRIAASVHESHAIAHYQAKRYEPAETEAEACIRYARVLTEHHSPVHNRLLGGALGLLGGVKAQRRDLEGAAEQMQDGITALEAALQHSPHDYTLTTKLVVALRNLAEVRRHTRRLGTACILLDKAIGYARDIVRDFPAEIRSHSHLAQSLLKRGQFAILANDHAGAETFAAEAVVHANRALRMLPNHEVSYRSLVSARKTLFQALHHRGAADEILSNTHALRKEVRSRHFLETAMQFAQCAGLYEARSSRTAPEQQKRAEAVANAIELLEKVAGLGKLPVRELDHKRLRALRDEPAFLALRKRLEKKDG